jgi:thiol-disulfide isomerase/thioredoxin
MRLTPWRRHVAVVDNNAPIHRAPDLGPAVELSGVGPWFNTTNGGPLTLAALAGHVVLLEFWTFACSNCIHTLPFLEQTHTRFGPDLTVIGIHTPEFSFEREPASVAEAIRLHGLTFPVGLDNDFTAWGDYGNRYWPTQYLIDQRGRIRYTHIGEGQYRRTESAIRSLLVPSRA